jgi:tRNA (guanine-N7-)-methyltransferase
MRKIQSFVRRSGRLTLGQKMGLTDFWKDYGVDLPKGKIDLNALFIKRQEVVLEVGFGNGDSLLEMAISMPDKNFLGIEVYEAGIGRLINEAHKCQLGNLKIIQADAVEVLTEHIENDSLSRFQLFFPDPWHKKKHTFRHIHPVIFPTIRQSHSLPQRQPTRTTHKTLNFSHNNASLGK